MSKRDDDSSADLDVGMTTAERRRRRRRGALRVPSDNVPRRAPTSPPVVAPVPEDPALAMSIAYSFSNDASDAVPRQTLDDLVDEGSRRAERDDDRASAGNAVPAPAMGSVSAGWTDGHGKRGTTDPFAPVAPEAASTMIDPPSSPVESQDFEMKTREMAAVDLEALGLAQLEPRTDVRAPLDERGDELPSIIIEAEPASAHERESSQVLTPFRDRRIQTDPIERPDDDDDDADDDDAPSRDSEVEVDVGGLESSTLDTDLPDPGASARTFSAAATLPGEMSSPGIALSELDLADEATSIGSVPDDGVARVAMSAPGIPTPPVLPATQAAPTGRPRLKTVALSESDLEEVLEAARAATSSDAPKKALATTIPGVAPTSAPAAVPAVLEEDRSASGSGEIEVEVEVAESDRAETRRASVPPPPPAVAALAPLAAPAVQPPPAPTVAGLAGSPAAAQPPPTPAAAKAEGAHPPPPPPERHRAPPTPPPPSKKVSTPPPAAVSSTSSGAGKDKQPRGKPWFVDLFDEDYLRTLPFLTAQATQAEAEFVIDAMNLAPGAQLLDVGCGYGRHAMELAARGYHLVGLDLSTPLLVRGGEESHRRGLTINFVRGDMRELDFDAQFDGAYCLFSTFGYFDDETNKKALSNIARALRPGGRVLIEILNRDYVIADLPTRVWWEGDGCVVLEEVELNYFSSRIQVNRSVVFDDGRQLEQEISIRAYALHEVGKLMHAAGFRVLEVSGGYQTRGRFFGNQSRHIIVLAERKDPSAS